MQRPNQSKDLDDLQKFRAATMAKTVSTKN